MDVREVCLTVICEKETDQQLLADMSKEVLKQGLGSHYRIHDLVIEKEDISGYPAVSFMFFVRGGYTRDNFKDIARFFTQKVEMNSIALWGLGWEGPATVIPDDLNKNLIVCWLWSPIVNKLIERTWGEKPGVNVHYEDFDAQPELN